MDDSIINPLIDPVVHHEVAFMSAKRSHACVSKRMIAAVELKVGKLILKVVDEDLSAPKSSIATALLPDETL